MKPNDIFNAIKEYFTAILGAYMLMLAVFNWRFWRENGALRSHVYTTHRRNEY